MLNGMHWLKRVFPPFVRELSKISHKDSLGFGEVLTWVSLGVPNRFPVFTRTSVSDIVS